MVDLGPQWAGLGRSSAGQNLPNLLELWPNLAEVGIEPVQLVADLVDAVPRGVFSPFRVYMGCPSHMSLVVCAHITRRQSVRLNPTARRLPTT